MPRKRNPILGRAMDLIALCSVRKMPMISTRISLLLFKRTKRFHLLKHYNCKFVTEYEFSPSDTPLFRYPRRPDTNTKKRKRFLSLFLCGGRNASESSTAERGWGNELEALSIAGDQFGPSDGEEEEVSVDWRAEMFIQRFYEEMKNQRRRSL